MLSIFCRARKFTIHECPEIDFVALIRTLKIVVNHLYILVYVHAWTFFAEFNVKILSRSSCGLATRDLEEETAGTRAGELRCCVRYARY
jgi:hypothetical protein